MSDLTTHSELVPSARQEGDALILKVRGEVDLHSSPDLRTSLLALLQSTGAKKLVLNLADVPYMDSSAIAVMVEALQKLRKTGGKVCLTNLQPRVKGLLAKAARTRGVRTGNTDNMRLLAVVSTQLLHQQLVVDAGSASDDAPPAPMTVIDRVQT